MVIEAGAAQGLVVDVETQWLDKVQLGARIGAQADHVAGVGRNLGLVKDDGDHSGACWNWLCRMLRATRRFYACLNGGGHGQQLLP